RVPRFLQGSGSGWVTAEYAMLPRATSVRTPREVQAGRPSGRTQEIQRLVGRSLRAVTALERMGEGTITIDCDVLQADGGTRTASITAGYLALAQAVHRLQADGSVPADVLVDSVAAVSTGVVGEDLLLDLCYEEDARAQVDFNVVMTGRGDMVEVQGTAEGKPFSRRQLDDLVGLAAEGVRRLTEFQHEVLDGAG
ncbi:MAG: ribonuclease PH, partial [Deltaproteobacteria bacterium]